MAEGEIARYEEKLLVTSNFSFSHSVFKRLVYQGRQKVSVWEWVNMYLHSYRAILDILCLHLPVKFQESFVISLFKGLKSFYFLTGPFCSPETKWNFTSVTGMVVFSSTCSTVVSVTSLGLPQEVV